jgi:hypothetical protein
MTRMSENLVEKVLRAKVNELPREYRDSFTCAIYNEENQRLVGTLWSLCWNGRAAYLI